MILGRSSLPTTMWLEIKSWSTLVVDSVFIKLETVHLLETVGPFIGEKTRHDSC